MSIIELFESFDDLIAGSGVAEESIQEAERALGLRFAKDYHQYLLIYGIAAINSHELTGLGQASRTSVVDVTLEEKKIAHLLPIPENWYVIEKANIDGAVIWQSSSGEVFQVTPRSISHICDSLMEYISQQ